MDVLHYIYIRCMTTYYQYSSRETSPETLIVLLHYISTPFGVFIYMSAQIIYYNGSDSELASSIARELGVDMLSMAVLPYSKQHSRVVIQYKV